jgi:hypothetical protein
MRRQPGPPATISGEIEPGDTWRLESIGLWDFLEWPHLLGRIGYCCDQRM